MANFEVEPEFARHDVLLFSRLDLGVRAAIWITSSIIPEWQATSL
jgi:hypothetical protein